MEKKELYIAYWIENLPTAEIANKYGISRATVHYWLKKYNIPRKPKHIAGYGEKHPRYRKDIKEKTCRTCEKKFRPDPDKVDEGKGFYCSSKCFHLSRRNRIEVFCEYCSRKIVRRKSCIENSVHHFCNKKCLGKHNRGKNNPFYGKHHSKETWDRIRKNRQLKPNKTEEKLIDLIKENKLPFRYVGDRSFIVNGLNPDFIECNGKKKIIELFGRAFHDPTYKYCIPDEIPEVQQKNKRKSIYNKFGFHMLVIWDDELKNPEKVIKKIRRFEET